MFIVILIRLVFGTITALIANAKGRSAVGWFFMGFFLGLIGLIVAAVMSDLKKEQAKEAKLRRENRRLKEQMRKDRMVAKRRHRDLERRIGAHDQVLGMETARPAAGQRLGFAEDDDEDELYDDDDEYLDTPSSAYAR